jgi:hypothetical protein
MRSVRINMPADTAGALIGNAWRHSDGHAMIEVADSAPISLSPSERGLVPDRTQWDNLKNWVALTYQAPTRIVGWYYAYLNADLADFDGVEQFMYVPHQELLLLVSPAENQGAFYLWRKSRFVPTGGFYEALPNKNARPVIPWEGELPGVEDLIIDEELEETPGASEARPVSNEALSRDLPGSQPETQVGQDGARAGSEESTGTITWYTPARDKDAARGAKRGVIASNHRRGVILVVAALLLMAAITTFAVLQFVRL